MHTMCVHTTKGMRSQSPQTSLKCNLSDALQCVLGVCLHLCFKLITGDQITRDMLIAGIPMWKTPLSCKVQDFLSLKLNLLHTWFKRFKFTKFNKREAFILLGSFQMLCHVCYFKRRISNTWVCSWQYCWNDVNMRRLLGTCPTACRIHNTKN